MCDATAPFLINSMQEMKENTLLLLLKKQLIALHEKWSYLELSWSIFSRIWTEYGVIPRIKIRENTDQKNSE